MNREEKKREEQNSDNQSPISLAEAADYLKLKQSYLYKLTSQKLIPHHKPSGKLIYFYKKELDDWIYQNNRRTKADNLISALVVNVREAVNKIEGIKVKLSDTEKKRAGEGENGRQGENRNEIEQKLKEASSVLVIFNDLLDEIEKLMGLQK